MASGGSALATLLDGDGPRDPGPPPPIERIVEAMLFAAEAPIAAKSACDILRGLTEPAFHRIIDSLAREYRLQNRPYGIQNDSRGYFIAIKPNLRSIVERSRGERREVKLSSVVLDTLAVVAYRQPVSRAEVDTLRGQESAGHLRSLVRLGLIAVSSGAAKPNESHYKTTPRFLELFGLQSLDDMPQMTDFRAV